MVNFVGAGPGAVDLITVRGMELLKKADVIIYAGSLVNPQLLTYAREGCEIFNSATMTLEEVMDVMIRADGEGKEIVRLHTGEPSIYGAIREQMDLLEYTLPDVSQTLIITRLEGRTKVPEKEQIELLASHGASMAIYLSAGMLDELSERLVQGGYSPDTSVAIVYKATWPEEKSIICTIGDMAEKACTEQITKTAVVLVGDAISHRTYERSKLYDPAFTTQFREGRKSIKD